MWYIKFQKRCRWLALAGLVFICIFSYFLLIQSIPDKIRIVAGREETFDWKVPVTGEVTGSQMEVFTNQSPVVSADQIHIDMNESFKMCIRDRFWRACGPVLKSMRMQRADHEYSHIR